MQISRPGHTLTKSLFDSPTYSGSTFEYAGEMIKYSNAAGPVLLLSHEAPLLASVADGANPPLFFFFNIF